jgi:hypothetical protein
MVEKIEIKLDKHEQVDKFSKVRPIVSLFVLAFYIAIVFTTIAILNTRNSSVKMASSMHGYYGSGMSAQIYYDITVYNLKGNGGYLTYELDEFELYYSGDEFEAYGFKTPEMTEIDTTSNSIAIRCDETEETFRIYFEPGSGYRTSIYGGYILYYDDVRLEGRVPEEALKIEKKAIITIETLAVVFIWIILLLILRNRSDKKHKAHLYKTINEKVLAQLSKRDFMPSKVFHLQTSKDGPTSLEKMMICVDNRVKKCCFVDYNKKRAYVLEYGDIVSYNVVENQGVKVVEENTVFGMAPTQVTKTVCKKLSLVIVMDDIDDTNVVYDLIKSSVSIDSALYKMSADSLLQATSFLEVAKNQAGAKDKQRFVYCSYCGAKNKVESLRCESCGSPLKD